MLVLIVMLRDAGLEEVEWDVRGVVQDLRVACRGALEEAGQFSRMAMLRAEGQAGLWTGLGGWCGCWMGSHVSLNRKPQKQGIDSDATVVGSLGRKGLGLLSPACQGFER